MYKCITCGKMFAPKRKNNTMYCSKRCKEIASKKRRGVKCNDNIEPYRKVCTICGKEFQTFRETRVTCSSWCAEKQKHKKDKRRLSDGTRLAQYKAEVHAKAVQNQERKALERMWYESIHTVQRHCKICGGVFYCLDTSKRATCSTECSRKLQTRRSDKRIPKNKIVDSDITLQKLFKRDGGICYLCGCRCSFEDWKVSANGFKYPGDTYPEIEHVVPVSRGGLHSWDNVRLACAKCNAQKRDEIIAIEPMPHAFAIKEKRTGQQAKRTGQYTRDGRLLRVYESTAQAERVTGISAKYIQNVCRCYKKTAHGFVWKYICENTHG